MLNTLEQAPPPSETPEHLDRARNALLKAKNDNARSLFETRMCLEELQLLWRSVNDPFPVRYSAERCFGCHVDPDCEHNFML